MKTIRIPLCLALLALPGAALASSRAVLVPATGGSVEAECAAPTSPGCADALERLAKKAADDLTFAANSGRPELRPYARDAARMPYAALRASAASALGRLSPGPEDTPLLATLLNDPVPAVRQGARSALESSSDPAARPIARRVSSSSAPRGAEALKPQAAPGAETLRTPVYPGAQYLFYAGGRADGVSEFTTADGVDAVAAFYAGKFGKGMTLEEFEAAAKAGRNSIPDLGSQAYQDQVQAAMDAQKAYQDALKAGKTQQEASMAMVAAMSKKAPANPSKITDTLRRKEIYGSPRLFVVEKGMMPGAPSRLVAVYRDLALGRTGITVFTGPLGEN